MMTGAITFSSFPIKCWHLSARAVRFASRTLLPVRSCTNSSPDKAGGTAWPCQRTANGWPPAAWTASFASGKPTPGKQKMRLQAPRVISQCLVFSAARQSAICHLHAQPFFACGISLAELKHADSMTKTGWSFPQMQLVLSRDSPRSNALITVWDIVTGKEQTRLPQMESAIAFSPDGKSLVVGRSGPGMEGTLLFFDTATWKIKTQLPGHAGIINALGLFRRRQIPHLCQ